MGCKVLNYVWEHYPKGGNELLTLLALADWADDTGGGIGLYVEVLMRKVRASRRTVQRTLRDLEADGWLKPTGSVMGGRGHAAEYRIPMAELDANKGRQNDALSEKGARMTPFTSGETAKEKPERASIKGVNLTPQGLYISKTTDSDLIEEPGKAFADALPLDAWLGFVEYREQLGKTLTAKGMEQALNTLRKLHTEGHDPVAVIQQSQLNNWAGLFKTRPEIKTPPGGNRGGAGTTGNNTQGKFYAKGGRNTSAVDRVREANGGSEPESEAGDYIDLPADAFSVAAAG